MRDVSPVSPGYVASVVCACEVSRRRGKCPLDTRRAQETLATQAQAHVADLCSLLERALHDLRQGWPEAAYDAIGRARGLLTPEDTHRD